MQPKVFISYSWSNQLHQDRVREWAERLIADGVDTTIDIFDLKEGQDKYAFMERMVTDKAITHVLVISDKTYAEKADARRAGVGTESQIISKEVYDKVQQSKFIPIVCEFDENNNPLLPVFIHSRIWINFSTPELVNENWERLIRSLYDKPLYQKPTLGKPPAYLSEESAAPASPLRSKFAVLQKAVLNNQKGIKAYRRDFLEACISYADALRIRSRPELDDLPKRIFEDCGKLRVVRDAIVDWVLLESEDADSSIFSESLLDVLEKLRELKSRPQELNAWNDAWFEAHGFFVYETFLYIVAALIQRRAFRELNAVFTSHYSLPPSDRHGSAKFDTFDGFYSYSSLVNEAIAEEGKKFLSPAAELMRRQAQRSDIPFSELIQADLLCFLMACINPNAGWFPQTLYYAQWGEHLPLFLRSIQKRYFNNLAVITGISSGDELRSAVEKGRARFNLPNQHFRQDVLELTHAKEWDTL